MDRDQLDGSVLFKQVVDYVMRVLPPYETSVYLYLLRLSRLEGSPSVRIGKRSIGEGLGKGTRSRQGNYQHIDEKLRNLARDGFVAVGDTTREGTLYTVALPADVAAVRKLMAEIVPPPPIMSHYRDPELRATLFERDGWSCRYCGDAVTMETATLDHVVPVSRGGTDDPDNLAAACLMCNSVKSGRTYEEAAPDILTAIVKRRQR